MSEHQHQNVEEQLELVAFRLGSQEYCVNIMSVKEIRGWTEETTLPMAPDYVRGVINLRGSVVPIIDLSKRMGMPASEPSARHVTIIAQLENQEFGVIVDAVSDILTLEAEAIQPVPDVSCDFVQSFLKGVINLETRMISFLDLETIVPNELQSQAAA